MWSWYVDDAPPVGFAELQLHLQLSDEWNDDPPLMVSAISRHRGHGVVRLKFSPISCSSSPLWKISLMITRCDLPDTRSWSTIECRVRKSVSLSFTAVAFEFSGSSLRRFRLRQISNESDFHL